MQVEEGEAGSTASLDFAAAEFGLERLGAIVENDSIAEALWQVLQARRTAGDGLEMFQPERLESLEVGEDAIKVSLACGRRLTSSLVVGADGSGSRVRKLAGINQTVWDYAQRGIVSVVKSGTSNPGVAWQRFMEGGPLAFLPLEDGSSSIVWTRPDREAARLLEIDEAEFCAELESAAGGWPGAIESCGPRAAFDLTMRLSERYSGRRTVLVGDAAHVVHPLAGQGLNMGFLDAAALVELLSEARREGDEWSAESVLEPVLNRYQRWRRSDAEVMARGIHGIRALFGPPILSPLRRLGLRLVGKAWPAREAFVRRAAGLHADAPKLSRKGRNFGLE
jgi:ubiquinone biosynthesis UbiH/UbiF/VisC/COQ6 family hydroxylase